MTDDKVLAHRQIWELLPWIVNGSASAEQFREVDAHLADCIDCRDELTLQRRIHAAMNGEAAGGAVQVSLARLIERIDAPLNPDRLDRYPGIGDEVEPNPPPARDRHSYWRAGLAALLIAQSGALAVMAYQLQQRPALTEAATAAYQTLSQSEAASPQATIRFVPAPELTVQDLQAMLDEAGLRIVDSRARGAIYGLAPISADPMRRPAVSTLAIALLRGKAGVLLVEPIATATETANP